MTRHRAQGFTLIEILFALGLFLLVAVPIIQTEMLAASSVNTIQQRREALAIASARLDAIQHATTIPDDSTDVDGYQVSTSTGHVEGLPVPLTRIQIEVRSRGRLVATLSAYRM